MVVLSRYISQAALYRFVVIGAGLLALMGLLFTSSGRFSLSILLFLAAVAFVVEQTPIELPSYGIVSGLEAIVFAAVFLDQAGASAMVLAAGVASRAIRRGKSFQWGFSIYTFCQLGLCFVGAFSLASFLTSSHLVAFVIAVLLVSLFDQMFAAYHLYLLQGSIGRPDTRIEWARLRLSAFCLLPLGLLIGSCVEQGAATTLLLFIPLAVAFNGLKTYMDTLKEAREVVASLVEAVERREIGSSGHSERVAQFAGDIAREMRITEGEVRKIVMAARMHDLGKIGIDEQVLNNPGVLSENEVAALRRHPEVGAKVAAHLSLGKQEAEFIYYHHEKFDGTGYPMGLSGNSIPRGARILAVAEAYDSMVSREECKGGLTPDRALCELELWQGSQFDPTVVMAFKNVMLKKSA